MIEGLEKRGEWFVPSSSSAKFKKSSLDQEVAAIEANIKSLRKAMKRSLLLYLILRINYAMNGRI